MVQDDFFVRVVSRQTKGFRPMNTSVPVYFVLLQDIVTGILFLSLIKQGGRFEIVSLLWITGNIVFHSSAVKRALFFHDK